jgi:hypothetical protein
MLDCWCSRSGSSFGSPTAIFEIQILSLPQRTPRRGGSVQTDTLPSSYFRRLRTPTSSAVGVSGLLASRGTNHQPTKSPCSFPFLWWWSHSMLSHYTKKTGKMAPKAPATEGLPGRAAAAQENRSHVSDPSKQTPRSALPLAQATSCTNSPPTPTDYEIMTESCDWCLADNPWDDADLFGSESSSLGASLTDHGAPSSGTLHGGTTKSTTQTTPPAQTRNVPQVNLHPRPMLDMPMM